MREWVIIVEWGHGARENKRASERDRHAPNYHVRERDISQLVREREAAGNECLAWQKQKGKQ